MGPQTAKVVPPSGDRWRTLREPTPTDADPTGSWYAFEKGAEKFDGRDGFADVWKKGFFAIGCLATTHAKPNPEARGVLT